MPSQLPAGDPVDPSGRLPSEVVAQIPGQPFGVYLHVPFCQTRCGYCDFNTYTPSELGGLSTTNYLQAAQQEIAFARRVLPVDMPPISTIFLGGGTPTLLEVADVAGLIDQLAAEFGLLPNAEITIEANPETIDPQYLSRIRATGVNRISIGMQSVVPEVLHVLERAHTPRRGLDAAHWASEAGFSHISLDLIYGAPGETVADWETSLAAALSTPIDHISAYSLIVEPGTRLAKRVERGELPTPDDDDLAEKYLLTEALLGDSGLENYEVSNWARQGGQCQHNLGYWLGHNWWGIGPGAHSHLAGLRFWNRKHPASYVKALQEGTNPALAQELLTSEQRRVERVLLELRLAGGLPLEVLSEREQHRLTQFISRELVVVADARVRLTLAGRLLADGIVRDLLD